MNIYYNKKRHTHTKQREIMRERERKEKATKEKKEFLVSCFFNFCNGISTLGYLIPNCVRLCVDMIYKSEKT